jgi:hypothetical protein
VFELRFATSADDRQALLTALNTDIASRLQTSGAWLYGKTGNDADGYTFKYLDGRSVGTLTITPPHHLDEDHLGSPHGHGPAKESLQFLSPGEIPIGFTISAEEKWTK